MTMWCTFGLVGFGLEREALFPEIRLGIVAIGWCRGALHEHIAKFRASCKAALQALKQ